MQDKWQVFLQEDGYYLGFEGRCQYGPFQSEEEATAFQKKKESENVSKKGGGQ